MDVTSNGTDDFGFSSDAKYSEDKEAIAYNILKQQMSVYQNLIPGESDEIFIPPAGNAKHHSGPRALHVDMQVSETDSSQSTSMFTPQDYQSESNKTPTISSYIKELKSSKSSKQLNYSRAVQCIALPAAYKNRKDLEVSHVIPTKDTNHVLVILTSSLNDRNSVMLLYALNYEDKMVKLNEDPMIVRELYSFEKPVEAHLLVQLERSLMSRERSVRTGPEGTLIMVCVDGAVRLIKLSTLRTGSVARLEAEKFITATYCNSKCFYLFMEGDLLDFYVIVAEFQQ